MASDTLSLNTANDQPSSSSVLIVDDVMKNVQLLFSILADEGFDIHFATSGHAVLEHLKERQVDIILLDIMMPEMDGFEVCRRLKENPATRDIPVIFLTAKNEVEDKVRGFSLGAVDYITKPFQAPEVLARIRNQLKIIEQQKTIRHYNERLEQMLEERTRDLVRSERKAVFGQLVQGIVHNLKNPLSSAVMSARMITDSLTRLNQEGLSQEEKLTIFSRMEKRLEMAVEYIELSHETLDKMISSLLEKSRADSSDKAVRFDLNDLIRRELDFFQADLTFKHRIEKDIELHPEPLWIRMVPGDMSQVVQNLLRNAIDAMYAQNEASVRITTRVADNHAVLEIEDNGPGIPEENREQIFEPFYSTKPSQNESTDDPEAPRGTGLGLWICRQMIDNVGGSIRLDSEMEKGTTFTITLPLAE